MDEFNLCNTIHHRQKKEEEERLRKLVQTKSALICNFTRTNKDFYFYLFFLEKKTGKNGRRNLILYDFFLTKQIHYPVEDA